MLFYRRIRACRLLTSLQGRIGRSALLEALEIRSLIRPFLQPHYCCVLVASSGLLQTEVFMWKHFIIIMTSGVAKEKHTEICPVEPQSRDQTATNQTPSSAFGILNTIVYNSSGKIIFVLIIGLGLEPTTYPSVFIKVWGICEANQRLHSCCLFYS